MTQNRLTHSFLFGTVIKQRKSELCPVIAGPRRGETLGYPLETPPRLSLYLQKSSTPGESVVVDFPPFRRICSETICSNVWIFKTWLHWITVKIFSVQKFVEIRRKSGTGSHFVQTFPHKNGRFWMLPNCRRSVWSINASQRSMQPRKHSLPASIRSGDSKTLRKEHCHSYNGKEQLNLFNQHSRYWGFQYISWFDLIWTPRKWEMVFTTS